MTNEAQHHDVLTFDSLLGRAPTVPTRETSTASPVTTEVFRYGQSVTRIDYIDDPDAPTINSVVPSVVAIVRDDEGRVLLIHKTDNKKWALPGGGHEAGESITETVVREVKEETGYDVDVETLTGTYTNPRHVMAYDDGEVRQQFSLAFRAKLIGGHRITSTESDSVEWVAPEDLAALDMHPSMRQRIDDALADGGPFLR